MSTQEFKEQVGQVVQAETVTQTVTQFINDGGRALTLHERRALNDRVKRLEGEFDENGATVWRTTHAALGIQNIEEMRLGHYDAAVAILDLMLERADLKRTLSLPKAMSEKDALFLAQLRQQSSDLEKRLKDEQRWRRHLEGRLAETENAVRKIMSERDSAIENSERLEKVVQGMAGKNRQLQYSEQRARRRGNRMVLVTTALLLTLFGVASGILYQPSQADAAVSECELNGKIYAIGSAMPGRSDQECARSDRGRAEWRVKRKTKP